VALREITDYSDIDSVGIQSVLTHSNERLYFPEEVIVDLSKNAEMPLIAIVDVFEQEMVQAIQQQRVSHILPIAKMKFDLTAIYEYALEKGILLQNLEAMLRLIFDTELLAIFKASDLDSCSFNVTECLQNLHGILVAELQGFLESPSKYFPNGLKDGHRIGYFARFVQMVKQFVDTLDCFKEREVMEFKSFEFQALPRYSVVVKHIKAGSYQEAQKYMEELSKSMIGETNNILYKVYREQQTATGVCKQIQEVLFNGCGDMTFNVLEYSIEYKNELQAQTESYIMYPYFERTLLSLVAAMHIHKYVLLNGYSLQGKKSLIRCLAQATASNLYEYDCEVNQQPQSMEEFIKGVVSGGFWLLIKDIQTCPVELLSVIGGIVENLKENIGCAEITMKGKKVAIQREHQLFMTFRVVNDDLGSHVNELPNSLLHCFRVVTLSRPNPTTLLSHLVAPVMKDSESTLWAKKLFLYSQLFSNVDFNLEIQEIHDQDTDLQHVELSLKTLRQILATATQLYFNQIDTFYEKLRDPATSKYRVDINRLILPFNTRALFTKLFRSALVQYLSKHNLETYRISSFLELYQEVFRDELEDAEELLAVGAVVDKHRDKILQAIGEFKELFPESSVPEPVVALKRIEGILEQQLGLHGKPGNVLIYGQSGFGKSMMVRLVGFVYSELTGINFGKYWVNIDAIPEDYLFGHSQFDGIISEILAHTHGIDMEDKPVHTKKINILFQANSEVFVIPADPREQKKLKQAKEYQRGHSWIILDGNAGKKSETVKQKMSKCMSLLNSLHQPLDINHIVGMSQNLRLFYELPSIEQLDPRSLAITSKVFLDRPLVDPAERVAIWLSYHEKLDIVFKILSPKIKNVLTAIVLPLINQTASNKEGLLYSVSELTLLNSFFFYFELFVNEFRKFYLLNEFDVVKENPSSFETIREDIIQWSKVGKKVGTKNNAGTAQMKFAKETNAFTMIRDSRPGNTAKTSEPTKNIWNNIQSIDDLNELEYRRLEGITVFAIIQSIYGAHFDIYHKGLNLTLTEIATSGYLKTHKLSQSVFGHGVLSKMEKLDHESIVEYYFDIARGEWLSWDNYQLKLYNDISPSFSNRSFSRNEIDRLQCQNSRLIKNEVVGERDMITLVGLGEKLIIENKQYKMMSYFVEYFVAYQRNLVVVSDHQQGKSLMIQSILRRVIEQNKIVTVNFQMQPKIDQVLLQRQVEANLHKDQANSLSPPKEKQLIIWIDDVQLSVAGSGAEALMMNLQVQKGWFSYKAKNYTKIHNTQFIMSMSIKEANVHSTHSLLKATNPDLMSKNPVLKSKRLNHSDLKTIFNEIVREKISSTPSQSCLTQEKTNSDLFREFMNLVINNREVCLKLFNMRMMNLQLECFVQLAQAVNLFHWPEVNKDIKNTGMVWLNMMNCLFVTDIGLQLHNTDLLLKNAENEDNLALSSKDSLSRSEENDDQRMKNVKIKILKASEGLAQKEGKRGSIRAGDVHSHDDMELQRVRKIEYGRIRAESYHENGNLEKEGNGNQQKVSRFAPGRQASSEFGRSVETPSRRRSQSSNGSHSRQSDSGSERSERSVIKPLPNDTKAKSRFFKAAVGEKSMEEDFSVQTPHKTGTNSLRKQIDLRKNIEERNIVKEMMVSPSGSVKNDSESKEQGKLEVNNSLRPSRLQRRNSGTSIAGSIRPLTIRPVDNEIEVVEKKSSASSIGNSEDDSAEYIYDEKLNLPVLKKAEIAVPKPRLSRMNSGISSNSSRRSSAGSGKSRRDSVSRDSEEEVKYAVQEANAGSFAAKFSQKIFRRVKERVLNFSQCAVETLQHKRFFFDMMIKEINETEEAEKDYELYQNSFEPLGPETSKRTMDFFKDNLISFVYNHPEAILAIPTDKNHFGKFIQDYSNMHLLLSTPGQHLLVNSLKAPLYSRYLVHFICDNLFFNFQYFDIRDHETSLGKDTYHSIIEEISTHFEKLWTKNKKLVVMINISGTACAQSLPQVDRIFSLLTALIFNTDELLAHLDDRVFFMLQLLRKDSTLYSHLPDFYITYIIRQRLESKVSIVFLNERTEDELACSQLPLMRNDPDPPVHYYLYKTYPKLHSKFKQVLLNGLVACDESSAPAFYTPVFKFNNIEPCQILCLASTIELNYLTKVQQNIGLFYGMRSMYETTTVYNFMLQCFEKKFDNRNGDSESDILIKGQKQTLTRISRRLEIIKVDIQDTEQHINLKIDEAQKIEKTRVDLESKIGGVKVERGGFLTKLDKWQGVLYECQKEEEIYQKLSGNLKEARETLLNFKDGKDFLQEVRFGNFAKTQVCAVYAILFHEMLALPIGPKVMHNDLRNITVDNINKDKFAHYSEALMGQIANFESFQIIVKEKDVEAMNDPSHYVLLSELIERSAATNFTKYNYVQKALMKWIDLSIETAKFSLRRLERQDDMTGIQNNISTLQAEVKLRTDLIIRFERTLIELPELLGKINSKIELLRIKNQNNRQSLSLLSLFHDNLAQVQTAYLKITSPFIANNLDKNLTFQLLTVFILFWSKYPYQTKRILFLTMLKNLNIDPTVFNDIPVYTLLSKEPLFANALKSKIPFNLNLLNNISIIQFLQDSSFPFALIQDSSGQFIKWMQFKFQRFVLIDYLIPTDKTISDFESCMLSGTPYIVVDPREELITIIKPVIEWRYRRFCEMLLHHNENIVHHTYDFKFNQKRVIIKDSFRLIILFQNSKIESFDPVLLAKLVLLNNESDEAAVWKDTLADELSLLADQDRRGEIVQQFMDTNTLTRIVNAYALLASLLAGFDFLTDLVLSDPFNRLVAAVADLTNLAKLHKEKEQESKVEAENTIAQHKGGESRDLEVRLFMNQNYAVQVGGYLKFLEKYRELTDRLRVYHITCKMMRVYIGKELALSEEVFISMVRESALYLRGGAGEQQEPADLYDKIDKIVFAQVVNSIPSEYRYIYSFIAGVLCHLYKLKHRSKILKSLEKLLFSKSATDKEGENVTFTNRVLYDRYNKLNHRIKEHFINISSNMPECLSAGDDISRLLTKIARLSEDQKIDSENVTVISHSARNSTFSRHALEEDIRPINLFEIKKNQPVDKAPKSILLLTKVFSRRSLDRGSSQASCLRPKPRRPSELKRRTSTYSLISTAI
jgi:hypothetical protein